ncbi:MAG TPA: OmpA family protein [Aliidongia sp.]|uniref:OmpA family protein n=1 Tax=Aliidongia sp. TaxID=1914230 RepID=UPI002DDD2094|nr:OmpA family protein [Aliidongia sp.]HEV2674684.1 OmpA family protein [Aliidongia sp.]
MSKSMLLSIGFALLGAAASPALAASPANGAPQGTNGAPQGAVATATAARPDVVFNSVFIFFRNDDATLTPLMVKQVTRAAELAKQGGATRVKVTGYSDDAKHAENLGQARAEAVRAMLVKEGVPAAGIETQPRVKAPPASNVGGPNPANHRVRITLIRAFTAPVGPHDSAR